MNNLYQICTRCVMDTTDLDISFDEEGVCCHCHKFDNFIKPGWFPNDEGKKRLEGIVEQIKKAGHGKEYDCIIGLSGGIDSSYLAVKIKDYGLRPLVVHIDAGWNSELAVYNIEQVVKFCDYDLHTHVVDWEEMRDLQLAYLKSGVSNQDVPQDHIFFSSLYHFAVKNKIKYVINGGNIATEAIFPQSWHHAAMDSLNLHAIHRKYGRLKLKKYKTISFFQYYFYYPYIYRMKAVRPLNFMPYDKKEALSFLKEKIGYKEYAYKHGESVFTKFFQNYYLPQKFGFDKRRPHLSSRILSGQISRDVALQKLEMPLYNEIKLKEDLAYIAKKMQISEDELIASISAPAVDYTAFKNWDFVYSKMKLLQNALESISSRKIGNYS